MLDQLGLIVMSEGGDSGDRVALERKVDELSARVAELESEIRDLITDRVYSSPDFAVLTRPGIERRWRKRESAHDTIIFLDLDDLRTANARYGYDGANTRIAASLIVSDSTVLCGRWFSGDEIVYLCNRADAIGLARRLQRELQERSLSATIGIAPAAGEIEEAVTCAATLVQAAKARNERGVIFLDPALRTGAD